jgi:hypothetical protein
VRLRALALAALVAGGLAACGSDDDDAWTLRVIGSTSLLRGGEWQRLADGSHQVERDDRIQVFEGRAVLSLPGDSELELREGRESADDSVLRVADVPELLDGEMLLLGGDDGAAAVAGAATVRVADGAARLRRGASVTVGIYSGSPELEANGRILEVLRPLRQATVTDSGSLPRQVQPLTYDRRDADPWDLRFLGDAIDLDRQIEPRQLAVASGAERSEVEPIIGELAGDVPVDPDRSVGEAVVGAAIARSGKDGDLTRRWRQVFAFRDAGAPWGVVALDQQADRGEVLDTLDDVVRRLVQRFGGVAAGEGRRSPGSLAFPPLAGGTTTPPTTRPDGGNGDGGSPPPPTQPPSGPEPEDPAPVLPVPELPPLLPDDGGDPTGGGGGTTTEEPSGTSSGGTVDTITGTVEPVPIIGDAVDGLLGG